MKIEADIKLRGRCKHCGEWLEINKVSNHCAYKHGIYHSNWYKFKARIRRMFVN